VSLLARDALPRRLRALTVRRSTIALVFFRLASLRVLLHGHLLDDSTMSSSGP